MSVENNTEVPKILGNYITELAIMSRENNTEVPRIVRDNVTELAST